MYNFSVIEQNENESNVEFAERLNLEFKTIHEAGFKIQIFKWETKASREVIFINVNTIEDQAGSKLADKARIDKMMEKTAPKIQKPNRRIN